MIVAKLKRFQDHFCIIFQKKKKEYFFFALLMKMNKHFSPGRGLCDLQSIWLQFIFMKLRHASYSKVADQENGWQCFLQWNILLSLKSRLINRTIYKLMGKVISPGFVIFNTHFMQRERKIWVPWSVYLNCRNPCFCPKAPATSLYLTTTSANS